MGKVISTFCTVKSFQLNLLFEFTFPVRKSTNVMKDRKSKIFTVEV